LKRLLLQSESLDNFAKYVIALLRGLPLRCPSRLHCCYDPCAALWSQRPFLLAGAFRSPRSSLGGSSSGRSDESTGTLKAGYFSVDQSKDVCHAHYCNSGSLPEHVCQLVNLAFTVAAPFAAASRILARCKSENPPELVEQSRPGFALQRGQVYVRQCKTRPQCAARAVLCGGVKVSHRRILFS